MNAYVLHSLFLFLLQNMMPPPWQRKALSALSFSCIPPFLLRRYLMFTSLFQIKKKPAHTASDVAGRIRPLLFEFQDERNKLITKEELSHKGIVDFMKAAAAFKDGKFA